VLLYALAKFIAYSLWSYLGLHLLADRRTLEGALKFGAFRWLLGVAFGVAAAVVLGPIPSESVTTLYFGVYVPLRIVEWTILAVVIAGSSRAQRSVVRSRGAWLWVLGGVAISFVTDLASPEGMSGRFCVGRCLC
jgi:hypothetical protein